VNVVRACGLIFAFASVAMGLVVLRAEQARCASAALRHEARWLAARHEMWDVQSVVARLRAPEQIHRRLESFNLDVHRLRPARLEDMRRWASNHAGHWTD
jgi:hypothetical protein